MIKIEINQRELNRIDQKLAKIGKKTPVVVSRALNKTAVSARVRLKNRAQAAYTVKSGKFNKYMEIRKANTGSLCAEIRSQGSPLNLTNFKATTPKSGAKAQIVAGGGLKVLIYSAGSSPIKAFRGPNGLIFQRRGKKRKPIKKLFSNSIPVMIGSEERVYGVEKDNIQSDLNKYVSQQIAILIK